MMDTKPCSRCDEVKPLEDFHLHSTSSTGRRSECKACGAAEYAQWKKDDPEGYERSQLRRRMRRFGLDAEWYEQTLASQGGTCAICDEPDPDGRTLSVDHDRACCPGSKSCGGCVRGLLCGNCNRGLGMYRDDTSRLQSAIDYLEEHSNE